MRYWLFYNFRLSGPYDKSQIARLRGFSGDTLVCPADLEGTGADEWREASHVGELAALLPLAREASALPVEPTLQDVVRLRSLSDTVEQLTGTLNRLQQELLERDRRLERLRDEGERKDEQIDAFKTQLAEVEGRMKALLALQEKLEQTRQKVETLESTQAKAQAGRRPTGPARPPFAKPPATGASAAGAPPAAPETPPASGAPAAPAVPRLKLAGLEKFKLPSKESPNPPESGPSVTPGPSSAAPPEPPAPPK